MKSWKTTHTFDKSAEKAPRVKARKKHAANAPLSCVLSVVFDSISTKIVAFCVEIGAIELESNIVAIWSSLDNWSYTVDLPKWLTC